MMRSSASGPEIEFNGLLLDNGSVPANGQSVPFNFQFTNCGSAPLCIEQVSLGCRCMKAVVPDAPIAPGDSGEIKLLYHPQSRGGAFMHEIEVTTNVAARPTMTLYAAGFGDTSVRVVPARLDFGAVPTGESRIAACFVTVPAVVGSGAITDIRSSLPLVAIEHYRADAHKERAAKWWPEAHGRYVTPVGLEIIEVTLVAQMEPAPVNGDLSIGTNVDGFERIIVPISAQITTAKVTRVTPSTVDFTE